MTTTACCPIQHTPTNDDDEGNDDDANGDDSDDKGDSNDGDVDDDDVSAVLCQMPVVTNSVDDIMRTSYKVE